MSVTREQVEDFLFEEADLLDGWKLMEWADLFTEDGTYLVPTMDRPDGDYRNTLFVIADNRHRLEQRAKRLLKKAAHVEYPHATTRHMISNVRIREVNGDELTVTCNFITYRTKRQILDPYIGHTKYKLVVGNDEFKIKEKRVNLDLDALRPQGKVSIIL